MLEMCNAGGMVFPLADGRLIDARREPALLGLPQFGPDRDFGFPPGRVADGR